MQSRDQTALGPRLALFTDNCTNVGRRLFSLSLPLSLYLFLVSIPIPLVVTQRRNGVQAPSAGTGLPVVGRKGGTTSGLGGIR